MDRFLEFEANASARRFCDALGGEVAEHHPKEVLKEIKIPSILYVRHDLRGSLNDLKDYFNDLERRY
jgi:hypothetical protein